MGDKDIQKLIERHEGRVNHVYSDSLKIPTLGIGHALHIGSPVSDEIVDLFFAADFKSACDDYERLHIDLDPVRRAVIIDMLFALGLPKLRRFFRMLEAIRKKDYERAADELLDSDWANTVDPIRGDNKGRADELAYTMRTGKQLKEV